MRKNSTLDALVHLGAATPREVAGHTGRELASVQSSLLHEARAGRVSKLDRTSPDGDPLYELAIPVPQAVPTPPESSWTARMEAAEAVPVQPVAAEDPVDVAEPFIDVEREHRIRMRERYFTLLMGHAAHPDCDPSILDRIEGLLVGEPGD